MTAADWIDLTVPQLEEIRDTLTARVRAGLAKGDQEVLALPAYLTLPDPELKGKALAVDAGGTSMRAALVELSDKANILAGPIKGTLPDGREHPVDRQQFFEAQAALIRQLKAPSGLPLGYCFSYPVEVLPSGDARLLRWTKNVNVSGVQGTLVGEGLAEAVGGVKGVKVLNDTVASLMGGAYFGRASYRLFIGLIVGTGTNMATFLRRSQITKLEPQENDPQIAVNLESGNYSPPHLQAWDDQVDQASDNPGKARFEKAVSGFYLPYLMEKLCPDLEGFDPKKATGQVVDIRANSSDAVAQRAAAYLLDRSADLVAAGLAGLFPLFPAGAVGIQAEGGLFWGAPGYRERVEATLAKLLPADRKFGILRHDNVNLVGAACASLS